MKKSASFLLWLGLVTALSLLLFLYRYLGVLGGGHEVFWFKVLIEETVAVANPSPSDFAGSPRQVDSRLLSWVRKSGRCHGRFGQVCRRCHLSRQTEMTGFTRSNSMATECWFIRMLTRCASKHAEATIGRTSSHT